MSAPRGRSATGRATDTPSDCPSSVSHGPLGSDLAETFSRHGLIFPTYDGGGIGNVVGSVLRAFGLPSVEGDRSLLPPLSGSVLSVDATNDSRVVALIVLDGYGTRIGSNGAALTGAVPQGLLGASTITSVFPATTSAALTTLQTGVAPGAHGVAGYTLRLPSVGRVMNMVQFSPVDGAPMGQSLDPRTILPVPTVYQRLAERGIESVVVSHAEYARSPLTVMHSGDTPYRRHRTAAELATMLLREVRRPGKRFVFGYWAGIDMLGHSYGPASPEVALEAALIERALVDGFLAPLARGEDDVTVLLTADHGLAHAPEARAVPLPDLTKSLGKRQKPPTGERRAVGLSVESDEQRESLAAVAGSRGVVMSLDDAVNAGLFGPAALHSELAERIGDTLLLATGEHSFPFRPLRESDTHSPGAHGSATDDEMLVPLLAWRFGRSASTQ